MSGGEFSAGLAGGLEFGGGALANSGGLGGGGFGSCELALEVGDAPFQSRHALSELAPVNIAVARCSGSGRGPSRLWGRTAIAGSESCVDLGIGGGEQAREAAGELTIGREPGELRLPELEIATRQRVEVAIGHARLYQARSGAEVPNTGPAGPYRPGPRLLSHCINLASLRKMGSLPFGRLDA